MSSWIIEELAWQRRLALLQEAERERLLLSVQLRPPRGAWRLIQGLLAVMRGGGTTAAAPIGPPARPAPRRWAPPGSGIPIGRWTAL
jgi:hypothetical protein